MTSELKKILIVDDSDALLSSMAQGISNHDHKYFTCEVDSAVNGEDGLRKVKSTQYDLIITDMQMPEKNGPEFIQEIRTLESYEGVPIIFMSGYFRVTPVDAYESFAEDLIFLDKPFNMKKIGNILKILFLDSHSAA